MKFLQPTYLVLILTIACALVCGRAASADDLKWEQSSDCRRQASLDGTWKFSGMEFHGGDLPDSFETDDRFAAVGFDDRKWQAIPVPGDWFGLWWDRLQKELPQRKPHFITGWYRRNVRVPSDLPPGRVLIEFEAVDYHATVFVNGKQVGQHEGLWTPFAFDITDAVERGQDNLIAVRVWMDVKGFGGGIDHVGGYRRSRMHQFHLGGIHQSARLRIVPDVYVDRLLINPRVSQSKIDLRVQVRNTTQSKATAQATAELIPWSADGGAPGDPVARQELGSIELPASNAEIPLSFPVEGLKTWDHLHPNLYWLRLSLRTPQGQLVDQVNERFGYREFVARGRDFLLNGKPIYMFGECRVWVDLMDRGYGDLHAWFDRYIAELKENNYNFLRLHAGPAPRWMHEMCDERGMMLMPEWGHGSDSDYNRDYRQMREWILSRYNFPSVVMWSLLNECPDVKENADRYRAIRPLDDSGRPMTASAGGNLFEPPAVTQTDIYDVHLYYGVGGYPMSFMPAALDFLHGKVEKYRKTSDFPFIITESNLVRGGDINQATADEQIASLSLDEYLARAKELGGSDPEKQVKMMPLASIEPQEQGQVLSWQAAQFVKKLVESFLIRDDLLRGIIPWQSRTSQGKQNFQPCFIGTDLNYHNKAEFAGKTHAFTIYLRDYDAAEHADASVELWVEDLNGKKIFQGPPLPLGDLAPGQRSDRPYQWEIPADVPTGDYLLRLRLVSDGRAVSSNVYELYILGATDQSPEIRPQQGAVAVLKPRGIDGPSGVNLPQILDGLKIPHTVIESLAQIDDYAVLILPAYYGMEALDRKPITGTAMAFQLTEDAASFKKLTDRPRRPWEQVYPELTRDKRKLFDWINRGGRVLAFEQFVQGTIPWQSELRLAETGYNTFVDPVRRDHPAFQNFMIRDFADWEGEQGVIVDYSIFPLNSNVLAFVSTYGYASNAGGMAMAVAETRIGKGQSLISQLDAVRRYGQDSIATHYVNQLLRYVLTQPIWDGVRSEPSVAQGQRPAAEHFPPDYDPSFVGGQQMMAQSFKTDEIDHLTRAELEVWRNKDVRGDLIVELRSDDGHGRPGNQVLASARLPLDSFERRDGYPNWQNPFVQVDLKYSDLKAGRPYWIVARATGPYNFPHVYGWIRSKEKGAYPDGTAMSSVDGGKTWQRVGDADFGFRVYGLSNDYLPAWDVRPEKALTIDLAPLCNTGFRDEQAGDGQGGWTDQGQNDLRHMSAGEFVWQGVPVRIIDPAGNNGASCIMLSGKGRETFPRQVTGIAVNSAARALYFVHTSAWGYKDGACYVVHYADGASEEIPLRGGYNISDWWIPHDMEAAKVGWTGLHPDNGAEVGVFIMKWPNPRPNARIATIDFVERSGDSGGIPVLLAITLERP